jgi:cysteine desulfurase
MEFILTGAWYDAQAMIYLDYAATTPVDERVLEAMTPYFCEIFANPSSKHACGRKAARAVIAARKEVAVLIGARHDEILFTGGASEATNLAIKGIADQYDEPQHFITSSFEHKATLAALEDLERIGHEVTYVTPGRDGVVSAKDIEEAIQDNTVLISLIHVNNEIGTIQPIEDVGELAKEHDILFHVDATQSFGKMPIDVEEKGIDLLSLSAHKVYGPKGVGALFVSSGIPLSSQISGGSQEGGIRAGTLNVPGIVGLGTAAKIAREEMREEWARLEELELNFLQLVRDRIGHVYLQGGHDAKVPWITNICFDGLDGGELRDALGEAGICVSRSSACAKSNSASHVLEAIECPKALSDCAIRFSFGRKTTPERVQSALSTLEGVVDRLRRRDYASSEAASAGA